MACATGVSFHTWITVFERRCYHISASSYAHSDNLTSDIGLEERAETLSSFSMAVCDGGQSERTLELKVTAMELKKRLLGGERQDTLRSMNRIGRQLPKLRRPLEAVEIDKQVVKSRQKLFGELHFEALDSLKCLATSYNMRGQFQEAMSLMENVNNLRVQVLGEEHTNILTNMRHLADCYSGLGRYKEALILEQKVCFILSSRRIFLFS